MSSGSGIKISDAIKELYTSIHKKSAKPKYRYAILKFNDTNTGLDIVETGEEKEGVLSYTQVMSSLPENDVRYILYDFEFVTKSDAKSSKVMCLSWHPQGSPVKKRMIVASTFSSLKSALSIGANESLEGDDVNDLDVDEILRKIGGKAAV